jgi:hypothetical protein
VRGYGSFVLGFETIAEGGETNMGFFARLFGKGGGGTKKYEDIFLTAHYRMKQSVEYAFKQAVEASVQDGVFEDRVTAADALYEAVLPQTEPEDKAELEKAKSRIK